MNENEIIKLSILAGTIMLKNGAETYRVEDTIKRILEKEKFDVCESFVTTTGVFASVGSDNGKIITLVNRVPSRTINLNKIALVNNLSRDYVDGKITAENMLSELKIVDNMSTYKKILLFGATGMGCGLFVGMFNGGLHDMAAAFAIGSILAAFQHILNVKKVTSFLVIMSCSMLVAFLAAIICHIGFGEDINTIVISSIMPLVPGVAITNAIRDTIAGDYMSGTSRFVDAILTAIAIAFGVGLVLKFIV